MKNSNKHIEAMQSDKVGRIPPQAKKIEQAVLGAMMVDRTSVDVVFGIVHTSDVFIDANHQCIYDAIRALYDRSEGVDLLMVSEELKAMGKLSAIGGEYYLIELVQKVASSAHVEFHCRVILQKFIKRRIIFMNEQINALAYDDGTDAIELLDRYQQQFDKVADMLRSGRTTKSLPKALDDLKLNIERLSSSTDEVKMVGVPTGFKRTDIHTGGYRPGDLVILAARPGMGKTAKVLKTVVENLRVGNGVGFVSLEMSMDQLTSRLVAIDTSFHLGQLMKNGFDKPKYFQSYDSHAERMKVYPFYVDDSGTSDLTEIIITAKAWKRKHDIKLLVVDYLQLMDDKSMQRANDNAVMSKISRRLKLLAKELEIPIIALSQLSRAVETRGGDKRPMLSDLRDSGAIEQDADIIEFIYRPEYYGKDINDYDYDSVVHRRCVELGANTEIIFAKFRAGSTGTSLLKWVGDKTKFVDVEDRNDVVEYIDSPMPSMSPAEAFDSNETKTVFDG